MAKVLKYGMVGGGPDAFIGDAHRRAIALERKCKTGSRCIFKKCREIKKNGGNPAC